MKKQEFKNLKTKSVKDLTKESLERMREITKIRASISAGKEKNLRKAKNLRIDLAQILTLIKEKELSEDVSNLENKKEDK